MHDLNHNSVQGAFIKQLVTQSYQLGLRFGGGILATGYGNAGKERRLNRAAQTHCYNKCVKFDFITSYLFCINVVCNEIRTLWCDWWFVQVAATASTVGQTHLLFNHAALLGLCTEDNFDSGCRAFHYCNLVFPPHTSACVCPFAVLTSFSFSLTHTHTGTLSCMHTHTHMLINIQIHIDMQPFSRRHLSLFERPLKMSY